MTTAQDGGKVVKPYAPADFTPRKYTWYSFQLVLGKGKGKAVPLQAWCGPEGSRKLSFPDFMTTAQDGGKVVKPYAPAAFTPGNTPGTHFC
jgi:hypothetical protein